MEGEVLRDDQWEKIKPFVPGGLKGKRGPRSNGRRFFDALLWMARSGASALKKAEDKKHKLITQRAEMISQNLFDNHSKEQFESQIEKLVNTVDDLKYRRKIGFENSSSRILTFHRFLELEKTLSSIGISRIIQKGNFLKNRSLEPNFARSRIGCLEV